MKESKVQIGLVLGGGGAKGAYQSGVVKYLTEIDFAPLMITGLKARGFVFTNPRMV
jgi:NTE family protein